MNFESQLNSDDPAEYAREEERISKKRAKEMFDTGFLNQLEPGTFEALSRIHKYLFGDIYSSAGTLRKVDVARINFSFTPYEYLEESVKEIEKMPQKAYDEIIDKYVEMHIAHPFGGGNGRCIRIWLDTILKKELGQVIDWCKIDRKDYIQAMEKSLIDGAELKGLLRGALTDDINNRDLYINGIDQNYSFEGYKIFKTNEV